MEFCSEFDAAVAASGPGAVFLCDPEGAWRLAPNWSRDAWTLHPGPHERQPAFVLIRDWGTGYIQLVYVTAASLMISHARGDVRRYDSLEEAVTAREAFGRPPICVASW